MTNQHNYLEVGKTYIEKDGDGLPTGSAFKYVGVVERWGGIKEHEFQCIEFDCEYETQHYDIDTSSALLESYFYKQNI